VRHELGWRARETSLLRDEFRRRAVYTLNTCGVLGRHGRHNAGAITPMRCKRPEISLFRQFLSSGLGEQVYRHTWMPAPPLESVPAIVNTGMTLVDILAGLDGSEVRVHCLFLKLLPNTPNGS
jgi:hypothetical protein